MNSSDLGRALSPDHLLARRGTGSVFVITAYELTGNAKRRIAGDDGGNCDERSEITAWLGRGTDSRVIEHYDSQDEDERAAEIEAAWEAEGMTLMSVPTELVPEIRALLARRQTA